jgi:hypothetical protein
MAQISITPSGIMHPCNLVCDRTAYGLHACGPECSKEQKGVIQNAHNLSISDSPSSDNTSEVSTREKGNTEKTTSEKEIVLWEVVGVDVDAATHILGRNGAASVVSCSRARRPFITGFHRPLTAVRS